MNTYEFKYRVVEKKTAFRLSFKTIHFSFFRVVETKLPHRGPCMGQNDIKFGRLLQELIVVLIEVYKKINITAYKYFKQKYVCNHEEFILKKIEFLHVICANN